MPIRGSRSAMPKPGGKPTGIFSSKGKQKQDGMGGPYKDVMNYALGSSTRSQPGAANDQGKRHQKHYGKAR